MEGKSCQFVKESEAISVRTELWLVFILKQNGKEK